MAPIRVYRLVLSPLLPAACRYHPSCSVYALGAISTHGPIKGLVLAVRRILRCHPFHRGGLDPVPPRAGVPAVDILKKTNPRLAAELMRPPPPYIAGASTLN